MANISSIVDIHPWRIFVFICCLPSLFGATALFFLPETPKFLISKRRFENAKLVFQNVFEINTKQPRSNFPVLSLYGELTTNNNEDSMEFKKETFFRRVRNSVDYGLSHMGSLLVNPYLKYLAITCFADFGLMASYYTLIMWFPEIFERFNDFEKSHPGVKAGVCQIGQVRNETFQLISRCDPSISNRVFLETLIIGLGCIPSSLSLSFFMKKIGKKYVLVIVLLSSGATTLALTLVTSLTETLILSTIFEALTSILETVIFCVIVELFPTNLRAPALAVTTTFGRLGAICGNLIFGLLIDKMCEIPIYLFACLLTASGIFCLGIPDRKSVV